MKPSSDDLLRINSEEVVWREVGDEVVVLHMTTATYLTINGSGRALWNRLAEGATPEDLVQALIERYGIEPDEARADVQSFLDSLAASTLLAISS
jgi:hypothetical protein